MSWKQGLALGILAAAISPQHVWAQQAQPAPVASSTPVVLTLKRAIELALQNSKDIQVAKIQASIADHAAQITKSQFMPNLYAGSGAGYTDGIPETPGGRAPSIFNVTYTEQVINEPLRGQSKEMQGARRRREVGRVPMLLLRPTTAFVRRDRDRAVAQCD